MDNGNRATRGFTPINSRPRSRSRPSRPCGISPPCKRGGHGSDDNFSVGSSEWRGANVLGKYHLTEDGLLVDLRALKRGDIYRRKDFLVRARAWFKAEVDRLAHLDLVLDEAAEQDRILHDFHTEGIPIEVQQELERLEERRKSQSPRYLAKDARATQVSSADSDSPEPEQPKKRGRKKDAAPTPPTRVQPSRAAKRKALEQSPALEPRAKKPRAAPTKKPKPEPDSITPEAQPDTIEEPKPITVKDEPEPQPGTVEEPKPTSKSEPGPKPENTTGFKLATPKEALEPEPKPEPKPEITAKAPPLTTSNEPATPLEVAQAIAAVTSIVTEAQEEAAAKSRSPTTAQPPLPSPPSIPGLTTFSPTALPPTTLPPTSQPPPLPLSFPVPPVPPVPSIPQVSPLPPPPKPAPLHAPTHNHVTKGDYQLPPSDWAAYKARAAQLNNSNNNNSRRTTPTPNPTSTSRATQAYAPVGPGWPVRDSQPGEFVNRLDEKIGLSATLLRLRVEAGRWGQGQQGQGRGSEGNGEEGRGKCALGGGGRYVVQRGFTPAAAPSPGLKVMPEAWVRGGSPSGGGVLRGRWTLEGGREEEKDEEKGEWVLGNAESFRRRKKIEIVEERKEVRLSVEGVEEVVDDRGRTAANQGAVEGAEERKVVNEVKERQPERGGTPAYVPGGEDWNIYDYSGDEKGSGDENVSFHALGKKVQAEGEEQDGDEGLGEEVDSQQELDEIYDRELFGDDDEDWAGSEQERDRQEQDEMYERELFGYEHGDEMTWLSVDRDDNDSGADGMISQVPPPPNPLEADRTPPALSLSPPPLLHPLLKGEGPPPSPPLAPVATGDSPLPSLDLPSVAAGPPSSVDDGASSAPEALMEISPTLGKWSSGSLDNDLLTEIIHMSGLNFAVDICTNKDGEGDDLIIML